ncbi:hypothetical protein MASR2M78_37550 [Treponema sp.]
MTDTPRMSAALAADLKAKGADLERTLRILELVNAENDEKPQQKLRLPDENDTRIEDTSSNRFLSIDAAEAEARIRALSLPLSLLEGGERRGKSFIWARPASKRLAYTCTRG